MHQRVVGFEIGWLLGISRLRKLKKEKTICEANLAKIRFGSETSFLPMHG
jgi:hypothetical protein